MEPAELSIDSLLFDPSNPRLPEELRGADQPRLLQYLYDNGVLEELARSMAVNGFFKHEPLIVARVAPRSQQYHVLEGNRRLAAAKVLLQLPPAGELGIEFDLDEPVNRNRIEELRTLPCFVVRDRDEVHKYLGFRHIGGIKAWGAEAKARYLYQEVERAVEAGAEQPFTDIGRIVGSNAQGVRNAYLALTILMHARDEFGLDITHVQHQRFGVWLRAMNSPDLRDYVGFGRARTYEEIKEEVSSVQRAPLEEVLSDMSPRDGQRPILSDSRDVTVYAKVLANETARTVLRRYRDLQVARQVVRQAELPTRLLQLRNTLNVILEEIQVGEPSPDVVEAAEAVLGAARALVGALRAAQEEGQ